MPKNNFKLFDENKSNMMTDADYNTNNQRLNGVQSGVASSQLQNKTLYQTALMCYALAQIMAANGYDANDADAVSTFINNMSRTMVQKVVDKASAADVVNQVAGKWIDAKQLGELKENVADNYLPLLGGTMLGDLILNRDPISSLQAATKQYVDGFGKIVTGRYVGTGGVGADNPTVVNVGFDPIFVAIFRTPTAPNKATGYRIEFLENYENGEKTVGSSSLGFSNTSTFFMKGIERKEIYRKQTSVEQVSKFINYKSTENRIEFFVNYTKTGSSSNPVTVTAAEQLNEDGVTYYYIALGSNVIGVGSNFIFTDDQTFSIPVTGKYNIELHGIGGNGHNDSRMNPQFGGSGGGSGQLYSNINFTKGQQIPVTVGKISSGDGSSSFGSYTVSRGGDGGRRKAGAASGDLASPGEAGNSSAQSLKGGSGGSTIGNYGKGADVRGDGTIADRGEGAIILTYVGK